MIDQGKNYYPRKKKLFLVRQREHLKNMLSTLNTAQPAETVSKLDLFPLRILCRSLCATDAVINTLPTSALPCLQSEGSAVKLAIWLECAVPCHHKFPLNENDAIKIAIDASHPQLSGSGQLAFIPRVFSIYTGQPKLADSARGTKGFSPANLSRILAMPKDVNELSNRSLYRQALDLVDLVDDLNSLLHEYPCN
ncbi:unnamed protein product [Dicrocoelium dendriticum]|nr:unnamed protein product [Dicrocoelium dendriticum]